VERIVMTENALIRDAAQLGQYRAFSENVRSLYHPDC